MSGASGSAPDRRGLGLQPSGPQSSLCSRCRHVQIARTPKGSTFQLCKRSKTDARFPKYPPQPVVACPGFED